MFFAKLFEMGLDAVGEWNPQLVREWQGRLRWRNFWLVLIPSLLIQALIVGRYAVELPTLGPANRYCTAPPAAEYGWPLCKAAAQGGWLINWPLFWSEVFRDLSFISIWLAIAGGVYLLVADLSKESRRGTLNFLRMSPQSSYRLFWGKALGVPVLIYIALLSLLPLQGFAALQTQFALGKILLFYGVLAAVTFCFYAAALWFGLVAQRLQGFQPWLATGGVAIALLIGHANTGHNAHALDWVDLFNPANSLRYLADASAYGTPYGTPYGPDSGSVFYLGQQQYLQWWYLPVGQGAYRYGVFAIANALILGNGFWLLLQRRFRSPAASIVSKDQSYGLTLCLSLGMIGFDLQSRCGDYCADPKFYEPQWTALDRFVSFVPLSLVLGLLLIGLLFPSAQALLDWLRYRRQQGRRGFALVQDLLHHDSSPPALAFLGNWGLMLLVLALGLVVQHQVEPMLGIANLLAVAVLSGLLLLNGLLVLQWLAIADLSHWPMMAMVMLLGIGAGAPIALAILGIYPGTSGGSLWLLTVASASAVGLASPSSIALAFGVHLAMLTFLGLGLTRRMHHLGQSEWKTLQSARLAQP